MPEGACLVLQDMQFLHMEPPEKDGMVESDARSSCIEDLYQVVESTQKENAEVRNKN